jgi:transcriptional regulator with XRE-family HTH domain
MRQNPKLTPDLKRTRAALANAIKKANAGVARYPNDAGRIRGYLQTLEKALPAFKETFTALMREATSEGGRKKSAAFERDEAELKSLVRDAERAIINTRQALKIAEPIPSDVPATISQSSYDITVSVANTYPAFKTAIEDVAERIHTYVNMNDVSADYIIDILGSSTKTNISADLDLDMLKISVSCPLDVDSQDIIEQIVEGLVIVWDLEDPDFDDDVMGVLAEI